MKAGALLLLRISLGFLMLIWGIDKIVDPAHGQRVAETFYFGLFGWRSLLPPLGAAQMLLGALVVVGLEPRITYRLLIGVTGFTLVGVWRSVVDPWGWYLEGTTVLFYPSLVIFAGALVLWAFRDEDRLSLHGEAAESRPPGSERASDHTTAPVG